jgi:hypothetical protein
MPIDPTGMTVRFDTRPMLDNGRLSMQIMKSFAMKPGT